MIDQSLVNNVQWSVASLEGDKLGPFNAVPWTFHPNNTFAATGQWTGQWLDRSLPGMNAVSTEIEGAGFTDGFDVFFLGPTRFVAVKGGLLYRLGKKVGT